MKAPLVDVRVILNALIDRKMDIEKGMPNRNGEIKTIELARLVEVETLYNMVEKLPVTEIASVVHGKWEYKVEWFDNGFTYIDMVYHKCSECGFKTNWRDKLDDRNKTLYNYCPRCGAKMDIESKQ